MNKILYFLLGINLLLLILFLISCKSVHHEVIIHAPPETVWNVIIDMSEYPKWNPMVRLLEGEVIEGNKVKYVLTQDEDTELEIRATVVRLIPEQIINQKGGNPLIFSFNHIYLIEKKDELVKVTIHEDYKGIGVIFWNTNPISEAYARLNKALKERCENLSQLNRLSK